MKVPSIHLNGTSARQLLDDNLNAARHVSEALTALANAAPHGRDYYTQDDGAYKVARAEHDARLDKLRSVLTDLETIAEQIYIQRTLKGV